jgi:hypothetical protein
MPRLPRLPGSNPPTPREEFVDAVATAAAGRLEIDLLTSLVSAGCDGVAERLLSENPTSASNEVFRLAWMSHCTRSAEHAKRWAQAAREAWSKALEEDTRGYIGAREWSAMALVSDDPDAEIASALEGDVHHGTILEPIMALLALGRLDDAIDLLEERGEAVKRGLGWGTGILERYDEGFIENLLLRLITERRWDLLGRVGALSERHDGVFLASMTLSELLTDREDAADALAALPTVFLHHCFLHTLSRVPRETHASFAPLLERVPPHRRAIGEVLLGDPSKADALLAEEDGFSRKWDAYIVAILRDDEDAFRAVTGWDDWSLCRTSIGAIRALSIRGDEGALRKWGAILEETTTQVRDKDRPHVLAELGRELCMAGVRGVGEGILMEAFEMANAMERSSDQGWSRNNALGRVGCNAARAGAWQAALKALQKCTSKYKRPDIARELALAYTRIGDFGGAKQAHSFIKPDQTIELYRVGLVLLGALSDGLDGRFNQTGEANA